MKVSPVSYNTPLKSPVNKTVSKRSAYDNIPVTFRRNALADVEFNLIADTIRCQNLKNQMNIRLMNLKRNLNSCIADGTYNAH